VASHDLFVNAYIFMPYAKRLNLPNLFPFGEKSQSPLVFFWLTSYKQRANVEKTFAAIYLFILTFF